MDISDEKLNSIFEDLSNKHLLMYTTKKIRQLIKNVIDEIDVPVATRQLFIQKLQLYKFLEKINPKSSLESTSANSSKGFIRSWQWCSLKNFIALQ